MQLFCASKFASKSVFVHELDTCFYIKGIVFTYCTLILCGFFRYLFSLRAGYYCVAVSIFESIDFHIGAYVAYLSYEPVP